MALAHGCTALTVPKETGVNFVRPVAIESTGVAVTLNYTWC